MRCVSIATGALWSCYRKCVWFLHFCCACENPNIYIWPHSDCCLDIFYHTYQQLCVCLFHSPICSSWAFKFLHELFHLRLDRVLCEWLLCVFFSPISSFRQIVKYTLPKLNANKISKITQSNNILFSSPCLSLLFTFFPSLCLPSIQHSIRYIVKHLIHSFCPDFC